MQRTLFATSNSWLLFEITLCWSLKITDLLSLYTSTDIIFVEEVRLSYDGFILLPGDIGIG
jgi:hypothetical protein